MTDNFQLVTVYRSQGILGAEVVRQAGSGRRAVILKYESAGLVLGLTVDGLGLVEVQVPEEWEADALDLINEPGDEADAPADELADEGELS